MEAVRRAQEARQQAAAAAAMAAAVQQGPTVMPLASLMGGGLLQPGLGGSKVPEGALDVPVPPAGRLVRQSRSLDPAAGVVASALAQGALSMPLPSTSSGGAAAVAAPGRSSRARGKPASKPSPHEGSGAGPGKGSRAGSKQARVVHRNGQSPASADRPGPPPDLAPFGAGYTPRGPSAATPPKSWMLKLKDLKPALRGHLVQVRAAARCEAGWERNECTAGSNLHRPSSTLHGA